jgi:hypothetical protein
MDLKTQKDRFISDLMKENNLKAPTPTQTKPYGWQTSSSELKRVVTKPQDFSMQKSILPLKLRRITSSPLKTR